MHSFTQTRGHFVSRLQKGHFVKYSHWHLCTQMLDRSLGAQNVSNPLAMNSERSPKRLGSSNRPCWTFIRTIFHVDYFVLGRMHMPICSLDLDSPTICNHLRIPRLSARFGRVSPASAIPRLFFLMNYE